VKAIATVLLLCLASPVLAQEPPQSAPKWAVVLATAGPLADGITTYQALGLPNVQEGNQFYARLFGDDVTRGQILGFKVAQAALTGAVVYAAGKRDRKAAIAGALVMSAINFGVSVLNVHTARKARGMR
jgi:hypothetical protein